MPRKDILVCVTRQKTCERLIKEGARLISGEEKLYVVNVSPGGWSLLGQQYKGVDQAAEALEYLFEISKNYEAHMTVLRSEDVVEALVDFLNKKEISTVILGGSKEEDHASAMAKKIKRKVGYDLEVRILPTEDEE
ncbi:universal stress protein [Isachenkonia alkalipeptolytica]|uniref:Universal stress protein UspA n=1 Tax=Isachenkonia alkalipeptolytica TaxID=2565777 RepID=A0AA44BFW9_9CLOT|nr:universal stress protein [Isachenkonia alkalipeptolytica]NBG89295.1 universal stress protein UspA [Isachenkonia alkalipeptolytica]